MSEIKGLLGADVELIHNYQDMSVSMIHDNCTVVVNDIQRSGIWESDFFLKSGFRKSVQEFRATEVGKSVESAAFELINKGDSIKYEPIPKSFDMTSHDYYMNLK